MIISEEAWGGDLIRQETTVTFSLIFCCHVLFVWEVGRKWKYSRLNLCFRDENLCRGEETITYFCDNDYAHFHYMLHTSFLFLFLWWIQDFLRRRQHFFLWTSDFHVWSPTWLPSIDPPLIPTVHASCLSWPNSWCVMLMYLNVVM